MGKVCHVTVIACILSGFPLTTVASTVTYDFTATLSQPIGGSNQVSGSFTIVEDTVGVGPDDYVSQRLADPPVQLNFANHTYLSDPSTHDFINYAEYIQSPSFRLGGGDFFDVHAVVNSDGSGADPLGNTIQLTLKLSDFMGNAYPNEGFVMVPQLDLVHFPAHIITLTNGQDLGVVVSGLLTSLKVEGNPTFPTQPPLTTPPTQTPEPSTFALFGMIVLGSIAQRTRRRRVSSLGSGQVIN